MQIYKDWLDANNIRYNEAPFGLTFSYQGCNFILGENENDKQYLNLMLPGIYDIESNNDEELAQKTFKVLNACNTVNKERKCLKAILHDKSVWLHLEMFIDSTPDIEDFMERLLTILMQGRMVFMMEMMK